MGSEMCIRDRFEPQGETDVAGDGTQIPSDPSANLTVDLGFVSLALGGSVFADEIEDGVQDDGSGLANVPVQLLDTDANPVVDGSGEPIATTTDDDGVYLFDGVDAGTYVVEIPEEAFVEAGELYRWYSSRATNDPVTGVSPDPDDNDGLNDGDDNGDPVVADVFAGSAVRSQPVTLDVGQEPTNESDRAGDARVPDDNDNLTVDFAMTEAPLHELGGSLWVDADNDGARQPSETAGPAGVELGLLTADGQPVLDADGEPTTAQTDPNGAYVFTDLDSGSYRVAVLANNLVSGALEGLWPSTGSLTSADPNDDASDLNDGQPGADSSVLTAPVVLYPETEPTTDAEEVSTVDSYSNLTVDFGFYSIDIVGSIWVDATNDGQVDASEAPAEGVSVVLLHDDGTPVLRADGSPVTAVTDENGEYVFSYVPEGVYRVRILSSNFEDHPQLSGLTGSVAEANAGFNEDGSFDSIPFSVTASDSGVAPAVDLGLTEAGAATFAGKATLVVNAWTAAATDGERTDGDQPMAELNVLLLHQGQDQAIDGVTDGSGELVFDQLPAGSYVIGFEMATGYTMPETLTYEPADATAVQGRSGIGEATSVSMMTPDEVPAAAFVAASETGLSHVFYSVTLEPTSVGTLFVPLSVDDNVTSTVDAPAVTDLGSPPDRLAFTGINSLRWLLMWSLVSIAAGVSFTWMARRRIFSTASDQ